MAPKKAKAADEDEQDDQGEWTPDKPLEDEDAEEEANSRAQAHARYDYLKARHLKSLEKGPKDKKKKSMFE